MMYPRAKNHLKECAAIAATQIACKYCGWAHCTPRDRGFDDRMCICCFDLWHDLQWRQSTVRTLGEPPGLEVAKKMILDIEKALGVLNNWPNPTCITCFKEMTREELAVDILCENCRKLYPKKKR